MSDTPTLPPGWRASKAPNGKTFYYNRETKETQWNPPAIDRAKLAERAKQAGVFGTAPRRDVPSPRPPIGASKSPRKQSSGVPPVPAPLETPQVKKTSTSLAPPVPKSLETPAINKSNSMSNASKPQSSPKPIIRQTQSSIESFPDVPPEFKNNSPKRSLPSPISSSPNQSPINSSPKRALPAPIKKSVSQSIPSSNSPSSSPLNRRVTEQPLSALKKSDSKRPIERSISRSNRSTDLKRINVSKTMRKADTALLFDVDVNQLDWSSYEKALSTITANDISGNTSLNTDGFLLNESMTKVVVARAKSDELESFKIPNEAVKQTAMHIHYCIRLFNADNIIVQTSADLEATPAKSVDSVKLIAHDSTVETDENPKTSIDNTLLSRDKGVHNVSYKAMRTGQPLFTARLASGARWASSPFVRMTGTGTAPPLQAWTMRPEFRRVLLSITAIDIDAGQLEPFTGTLSVWQQRAKTRLSETMPFQATTEDIKNFMGDADRSDFLSDTRHAIALLPPILDDDDPIVVLTLSRTLRDDGDSLCDMLQKGTSIKPKERGKWLTEAKQDVKLLAGHWQTFAYAAVSLSSLLGAKVPKPVEFYRLRVESYKTGMPGLIADILSGKARSLSMRCRLTARHLTAEAEAKTPNRFDELLRALTPAPAKDKPAPTIRRLLTFNSIGRPVPHTRYRNLLYIYPMSVSLAAHTISGLSNIRNIVVEVRICTDDSKSHMVDDNTGALRVLSGNTAFSPGFDQVARTNVVYHNRKPRFADEIKIFIPPDITSKHHLLFTFLHVAVDVKKRRKGAAAGTVVAQCALPLLFGRALINDSTRHVPLISGVMPPGYLKLGLDPAAATAAGADKSLWVDNGRPIFTFATRAESTVHSAAEPLARFFAYAAMRSAKKPSEDEKEAAKEIDKLVEVLSNVGIVESEELVVQFVPLMGRLLELLSDKEEKIKIATFRQLLIVLARVVQLTGSEEVIGPYVRAAMGSTLPKHGADVYKPLLTMLTKELGAGGERIATSSLALDALLAIAHKSLCVDLHLRGMLKAGVQRADRFPQETTDLIGQLFILVRKAVAERAQTTYSVAKHLNASFGRFACLLLDVLDRGQLFNLVSKYAQLLDTHRTDATLTEFKFTFLDQLASHRDFIALNAPKIEKDLPTLGKELWRRHFLIALILTEANRTYELVAAHESLTHLAVSCTDFLFAQFRRMQEDSRFSSATASARLASMYFPLVPLLADRVATLANWPLSTRRRATVCALWVLNHVEADQLTKWWKNETPARHCGVLALLRVALGAFRLADPQKQTTKRGTKSLSSSLNTNKSGKNQSTPAAKQLIEGFYGQDPLQRKKNRMSTEAGSAGGLRAWARTKEGSGVSRHSGLIRRPSGGAAAMQHIEAKYDKSAGTATPNAAHSAMKSGYRAWAQKRTDSVTPMKSSQSSSKLTAIVANEGDDALIALTDVGLMALDSLARFMTDFSQELLKPGSTYLKPCIGVLCQLAKLRQSTVLLSALLDMLRAVVIDFAEVLFGPGDGATFCSKIVYHTLRYCGSQHAETRGKATALLCILAKTNEKTTGSIARVKLQATIAVSKLVRAGGKGGVSFALLQASLREAARCCTQGSVSSPLLARELSALAERAVQVLKDSQQIAEFRWDPETTADLYYDIARGYIDAPDLRVVWLSNLAKWHESRGHHVEAAYTAIVAAALVARCMLVLDRDAASTVPQDFHTVYRTVDDERLAPNDQALLSLGDEVCRSGAFSESGVVNLLRDAINRLAHGHLHEARVECYRLLLPVYETRGNYLAQGICHRNLQQLCQSIGSAQAAGKRERLFANHYRVAFFGKKFGRLDGKVYVYREPAAVRLADFTERLTRQFGSKFELNGGKVPLISNKNDPIDVSTLNPNEPHMQIISIEPYFERGATIADAARRRRRTAYERAFDIDMFSYQTPFTKEADGKAMTEDVSKQWVRRTVLHTSVPLPSLRKRVLVAKRQDVELSPIEVGEETLRGVCLKLMEELYGPDRAAAIDDDDSDDPLAMLSDDDEAQTNVDSKSLQMILQGSLLLQVNAGPIAIVKAFLGDNVSSYDPKLVHQLRKTMCRFVVLLERGVVANARLLADSSHPLVAALDEALLKLKKDLIPLSNGMLQ